MNASASFGNRSVLRTLARAAFLLVLALAGDAGAWNTFRYTSTNAFAGPSTPSGGFSNAICYANGSLSAYDCGGTNYVAGNGMMFFSGGNQAAVNLIGGSPYLVYSLNGSATLQAFTTVYIGNYDYIDIDFGGVTVVQTSGSAQTVTVNVYSDTTRTTLIGTNSVSVPSGTPTAVTVSGGTKFKSATIAFPSAIVWGANDFLIRETPLTPVVTTGSASSIGTTAATLAGSVNDNGTLATVTFDYGTTTGYGTSVAASPATISAGAGTTAVSAALTGLACGTTYHFRASATNTAGTTQGSDASFTTTACPPVDLCPGPGPTTLSANVTTIDWCDLGDGEGLTVNPGVTFQTNHRPAITFSGGTVTHVTNRGNVVQDGPNFPIIYATAVIAGDLTNDGGTFSFINGANSAIQLLAGSVANIRNVNGGQILGQWEGLNLNGVTLTGAQGIVNTGTISAAGNHGVYLLDVNFAGGGGVANSGTIAGNFRGVHVSGTTIIPGGIVNSGTISGPPTGYSVFANYSLTKIDIAGPSARFVGDVSATDADVTVKAGATFANENAFDVKTFNVEAGGTLVFGNGFRTALTYDGIQVAGGFTNAGTVRVATGDVPQIRGSYTQTSTGTLRTSAQSLTKLFATSATLPANARIDVVTGDNCAGISIGQSRAVFYASTITSDGTFAVTDDCSTMDFVGSVGGNDVYVTAVAPNVVPTAAAVAISGTAQVGQVLAGTYTYADANGDAQDIGAGGTSYRFVRSGDNSLATAGDNVDIASGATGGTSPTYTVIAADAGRYFFFCVTPRAATGLATGSEACSAASAAVAKGSQSIAFGAAPSLAFGGAGSVSATGGASGNPVLFTSLTPATCSVSGSTVTVLAAGACTIAGDQAGDAGYDAAPQATLAFVIAKAAQSITFGPAPSLGFGGTATVSATGGGSGNPVVFTSLTPATCSIAAATVTAVAAGPCTIAADQAGGASHDPAPQATLAFAVAKASQVIAFGRVPPLAVDESTTVSANGGASGQPVVLAVATPATCRLAGSTLTGLAAGICTIVANQAGGSNHDAATPATQDIPVARGTQAIVPGPLPTLAVAGTGRLIASGGRSGLPVTFTSLTPSLCTVTGDIATGVARGFCQVAADQAGDANYLPAPQAVLSVPVSQSPPRFALTVSPNPARFRVPVRIRVEVAGAFGPVTGTVEIRAGNEVVAGCGRVTIDAGVAECESALLPMGVHWFVAHYAGGGAYTTGTSDPVLVNVHAAQAPQLRDTSGDGRASLFLERPDGGLYLTTVRGRVISDGQELAAPGSGWRLRHFGDFDGDGLADALMSAPDGHLEVWMIEGIGTVRKARVDPLPEGTSVAGVGDFNGDGRTDLLLRSADGALTARTMSGGTTLDHLPLAPAGDHSPLAVIDLDGDGVDDLVLARGTTIRLLPVRGGKPGDPTDVAGPGAGYSLAATGDFDADGYADLVFAKAGALQLWRLDATGPVQRADIALAAGWSLATVVDFDGAFTDELILAGPDGEAALWSLEGLRMSSGTIHSPGKGWRFVQAGDYDGNGQRDLLFEGPEGEIVAWLFEGGIPVARVLVSHPTAWRVIP